MHNEFTILLSLSITNGKYGDQLCQIEYRWIHLLEVFATYHI